MLTNSLPWKEELRRSADRLEKKATQSRWTERSAFLVERDIMVGAYAIRKLLDAPGRLSDYARQSGVPILSHSIIAPTPPDWYDALHWWELYDMAHPEEKTVSLRNFCNLLIHSFVFSFEATPNDDGLAGVFVNAEYESKKALIFIATDAFVELFRTVGNDYVIAIDVRWDKQGKRQVVRAERGHGVGTDEP